jgi:tRNA-dihydrouridine synthase
MLRHAALMARARGERQGMVLFRKHAAAYMRGVRGVKQIRPRLMQVDRLDDLMEVLGEIRPEDDSREVSGLEPHDLSRTL